MKNKWIYLAGLIIAVAVAFFIYGKYHVAPSIKLKELSLTDLDGRPASMEAFKGKKLVVCFSASWCGNCREELNTMASIQGTDLADVEILVISDEPIERVRRFKEKPGYPFTFLKMNTSFHEIGINSIPTSYIVNRNLEIKKETVGYLNWKDPSTLQHLKKLME